jgi:hypothetical protein
MQVHASTGTCTHQAHAWLLPGTIAVTLPLTLGGAPRHSAHITVPSTTIVYQCACFPASCTKRVAIMYFSCASQSEKQPYVQLLLAKMKYILMVKCCRHGTLVLPFCVHCLLLVYSLDAMCAYDLTFLGSVIA